MHRLLLGIFLLSTPLLAQAETSTAARSINTVGLGLYRNLRSEADNLCISPYSIQSALAMTYAGAAGETAAEMKKALKFDGPEEKLHQSFAELNSALNEAAERSRERVKLQAELGGGAGDPIIINLANRLFGKKGYSFRSTFLQFLEATYKAPLESVDFSDSVAAANKINGWVAERTQERIRNLIRAEVINDLTRLILVNAIYLKAPWEEKFEIAQTKPRPFFVGAATRSVPTMVRIDSLGYEKGEGFSVVSLPYSGGEFQFLVVVPDELDGLSEVENGLTVEFFSQASALGPKLVELHLPKFKIEPPVIDLTEELKKLGLATAFDVPEKSANFEKMAPRLPLEYLKISNVFHKTFFALDEQGTEAAAATAVIMALAGAAPNSNPPTPVVVKADRPFLFAVQHIPSKAVLFIGRVMDPQMKGK